MKIENHEVFLRDEGTLDTVLIVDGCRHVFDHEYAADFRNKKGGLTSQGFKALALEALEDHSSCLEIEDAQVGY